MRCGYEAVTQVVLGRNAGEVTAVVAGPAGALESFSAEYQRRPWLFLCDAQGQVLMYRWKAFGLIRRTRILMEEIYKSSTWYGLVPEQNAQYLDLSNTKNKKKIPGYLRRKIDAIADFHNGSATAGYHVETYVHYGADDSRHSWRDLIWKVT